jgi:hypothetical protein
LNDCLSPGQNLLSSLIALLLRFRRYPVALTADIEKAFLMVAVKTEDREFLKVLWRDERGERVSRFTRVPFGLNCGPFLLLHAIHHHLESFDSTVKAPSAILLKESLYMDDVVASFPSPEEAGSFQADAGQILGDIGMRLCKHLSTESALSEHSGESLPPDKTHKVLGLQWSLATDEIFVELDLLRDRKFPNTKRDVASLVASVFDPLGFASCWTLPLRLFLQRLWTPQTDWDSPIPKEEATTLESLIASLDGTKVPLPRFVFPQTPSITLHVFVDASEKAYAACIYATPTIDGERQSTLLFAKTKLAPLRKKLTIPRLELVAMVLGVRAYLLVQEALRHKGDVRFYSDSEVALAWVKGSPTDVFVRNRVKEIRKASSPDAWSHIPGTENPADAPSRGFTRSPTPEEVEFWTQGPEFLREDAEPRRCLVAQPVPPPDPRETPNDDWIGRFSSLSRATRVLSWMIRFLEACRRRVAARKAKNPFTPVTPGDRTR